MSSTDSLETSFAPFREKMLAEGLSRSAIRAFQGSYAALMAGETGMIPEDTISPAKDLPCADDLSQPDSARASELLKQTVLLKLNGGLGTGMGLEKAKSLLPVRGEDTFLDLIARQILRLRSQTGSEVPMFMLMNSFSTTVQTPTKKPGRKAPSSTSASAGSGCTFTVWGSG